MSLLMRTGAATRGVTTSTGGGSATTLFRIDHQSTSGGGTTYPVAYGTNLASSVDMSAYSGIYGPGAEDGTRIWNWSHETTGGYASRNFMRFYRWSGVNGDPDCGFYFNPTTVLSPETVAGLSPGPLYLRFRIRIQEYLGAGGNSGGMKWFLFGGPGITGERRMIVFIQNGTAYSGAGEALEGAGGTNVDNTCLVMSAGVSGNRCVHLVSNASGWMHIQMAWAYTGASGGPYMKIYVNNNNEGSPTASHTSFTADSMGGVWTYPEGWDTGHWANIVSTNSTSDRDAQIDVMDFEFGTSFDTSWAP